MAGIRVHRKRHICDCPECELSARSRRILKLFGIFTAFKPPGSGDDAEEDYSTHFERVDVIPPREMRELYESDGSFVEAKQAQLASVFGQVKVKVVRLRDFEEVWSGMGGKSRNQVSVWAPKLTISRNKMQICLGHYACAGFESPTKEKTGPTVDS
eukprot:TRINITY_DN7887_c0_g1_i1.p1 TRINITY_DN7887_c0_g1~~TRINITY_DN7887_c0_g1_i1.p1  ORF type:complete len:156 (-),score=14.07 TRINITY_DN7887_c0_g1_i1:51-518(-)